MKIDEEGYFDLTLPYDGNEKIYALFDGWCNTVVSMKECKLLENEFATGVATLLSASSGARRYRQLSYSPGTNSRKATADS
jgi:hypothetical protein